MIKKEITYVPGLYKIYDEIINNARDATVEDEECDCIKVVINKEENTISVENNGKGIEIVKHKKHNVLIPEMIFGELLTSSNYDDNVKRITGGRNGFGAKLANIFSTEFTVETVDVERLKKFKQTYSNNMSDKTRPSVRSLTSKNPKGYVKITFKPDLEKFGLTELTDDIVALFKKRVYDISATTDQKIKVFLNGKKLPVNNFKKYLNMYYDESSIIYEEIDNRWQIGLLYMPDNGHEQISYVNSICTYKGGNHVKYVMDDVIKKLELSIKKKSKDIKIKPYQIKENLIVFINSIIENPAFTSQTKEELKTKPKDFGSQCVLSDKTIKKIVKTGIMDQVLLYVKLKQESMMKRKTDGKKNSNLKGIPKLEDANWAGTKRSLECFLI